MGGISGHLMHPIDNLNLKTSELLDLCIKSAGGQLKMTEKIDGFGLHVIKVSGENGLDAWRIVRSKGDLEQDGVSYKDLDERFKHNSVALKFYKRTIELLSKLPENIFKKFELYDNKQKTYNCEILEKNGTTNTLEYKGNAELYVHNIWQWRAKDVIVKPLKFVIDTEDVRTDPQITYEKKYPVNKYINKLKKEVGIKGTLKNYYTKKYNLYMMINHPEITDDNVLKMIFNRIYECGDQVNLKNIKKEVKKINDKIDVDALLNELELQKSRFKEIIDKYILNIGQSILMNCHGYINENNLKPKYFVNAYENKQFTNEKTTKEYIRHLGIDNKDIMPLEGVVVEYGGDLYKWTGAFSPYNKLNSVLKFGA